MLLEAMSALSIRLVDAAPSFDVATEEATLFDTVDAATSALDPAPLPRCCRRLREAYGARWRYAGEGYLEQAIEAFALGDRPLEDAHRCVDTLIVEGGVSPLGAWTGRVPAHVLLCAYLMREQQPARARRLQALYWHMLMQHVGDRDERLAETMFLEHIAPGDGPAATGAQTLRAHLWAHPRRILDPVATLRRLQQTPGSLTEAALAYAPPTGFGTPPPLLVHALEGVARYAYLSYSREMTGAERARGAVPFLRTLLESGADAGARFDFHGGLRLTPEGFFNRGFCLALRTGGAASALGELLARARDVGRERMLAVAMAFHPRLGARSLLGALEPSLAAEHLAPACRILSPGALAGVPSARADALRDELAGVEGVDLDGRGVPTQRFAGLLALFRQALRAPGPLTPRMRAEFRFRHWLGTRGAYEYLVLRQRLRRVLARYGATAARRTRVLRGCMRVRWAVAEESGENANTMF